MIEEVLKNLTAKIKFIFESFAFLDCVISCIYDPEFGGTEEEVQSEIEDFFPRRGAKAYNNPEETAYQAMLNPEMTEREFHEFFSSSSAPDSVESMKFLGMYFPEFSTNSID